MFMRKCYAKDVWLCAMIITTLFMGGCVSDEPVEKPQSLLADLEWSGLNGTVALNDVPVEGASVEFVAVPESESVILKLSGVHPKDDIEIEVSSAYNDNGEVVFHGEQNEEDKHSIVVDGIYSFSHELPGGTQDMSAVNINVSYTVPWGGDSRIYEIPFDGNSGFFYNRERGTYPLATVDMDAQRDSCAFISKEINSKLKDYLKSLTFRFDKDGLLTVGCVRQNGNVTTLVSRYWIGIEDTTEMKVIDVEDSQSFSQFILDALTPSENQPALYPSYEPSQNTVRLYIDEGSRAYKSAVVIWNDLHHRVFPYLYDVLFDGRVGNDEVKPYFYLMEKFGRRFYIGQSKVGWGYYHWAFANKDPA